MKLQKKNVKKKSKTSKMFRNYLIGALQPRKLGEDVLQRLPADVGQHVEAAAVGHAHHERFHAQGCALVYHLGGKR